MFRFLPVIALGCIAWTLWCFWRILPFPWWGKGIFAVLYVFAFALLFVNFKSGDRLPLALATASYEIGTSWLIFFVYAFLLFALLWLGRLVHLVPASFLKDSPAGSGTVLGIICLLLVCGYFHYHHKYREEIDLRTEKPLERPLTIVMASDLHVGYHNRRDELARWVDLFNAEHPDLVLFGGDIVDRSFRPLREGRYDEEFRRIEAPVYACLGNHEYISGALGAEAFYEAAGIDFQFSGHTHHGQIWPGNWITDLMYEKAYGPHRRGATRYYVSSGLGIWGGKFRIGTRSEYVVLHLHN